MIAIIELLAVIIVYKDILFEDDNVIDACNLAFFKEPSETKINLLCRDTCNLCNICYWETILSFSDSLIYITCSEADIVFGNVDC